MRINIYITAIAVCVGEVRGEGLSLPEDDSSIEQFLNTAPAPDVTEEEAAIPPAGGFKKYYLRDLKFVRDQLVETIVSLPVEVKQSPAFGKVEALRASLDQVLLTAMKSDYFAVIDKLKEIETLPSESWLTTIRHNAGMIGYSTKFVVAKHIEQTNAMVTNNELSSFVWLQASGNFDGPSDWEGEEPPIDAAGIMILDPVAVVAQLKAMPYFHSHIFLNSDTAAEAFARYAPAGSGNPALKTKFAANPTVVISKWNELAEWLVDQKGAEQN